MLCEDLSTTLWSRRSTCTYVNVRRIDDEKVSLDGKPYDIVSCESSPVTRSSEIVLYDGWKIEVLESVRPLFVFTAFGAVEIFEMLELAVESLLTFSGVIFDVLAVTQSSDVAKLRAAIERTRLPDIRLHIRCVQAASIHDYAMARYRLREWKEFERFGPVVYLDTDIICNAPLNEFLGNICEPSAIYVAEENGSVFLDNDYFGKSLFVADGLPELREERKGFNSGILAGRTYEGLGKNCAYVEEVSRRWHLEYPATFILYDQPVCNYVLEKLGSTRRILQRWVSMNGNASDPSLHDRRGLIHFCGGVGNSKPKIRLMKRYAEAIGMHRGESLKLDWSTPLHEAHAALYPIIGQVDRIIVGQLRAAYGDSVRHGPFAGMRIGDEFSWGDACLKLLGYYEHYLHDALRRIAGEQFDLVANVGCGEGYYCIGLALLFPQATVFGFDIQDHAREVCLRAADLNGISDRVKVAGEIGAEGFRTLVSGYARPLLFIDIEGSEEELLDVDCINQLAHATIICESHDFARAKITDRLADRFAPTHSVEIILEDDLKSTDIPEMASMPAVIRMAISCEKRPEPMKWLFLRPHITIGRSG